MNKIRKPVVLNMKIKEVNKMKIKHNKNIDNNRTNRDFINSLFIDSNRITKNEDMMVTNTSFKMIDIYKQTVSSSESDNQILQIQKLSSIKK